MVSAKALKKEIKAGSAIVEVASETKKLKRVIKKSGKSTKKITEAVGETEEILKKVKTKSKKISSFQKAIVVGLGASAVWGTVNIGYAVADYVKRNNKIFTVTEIFHKENDGNDELSFVILNPDKIQIFTDESFVITYADPFFDGFFARGLLKKSDTVAYTITETKINKDKENSDLSDEDPDIPYVITIQVNGLDLSLDENKPLITNNLKKDKLLEIKLKADLNSEIKDEFNDDFDALKKTADDAMNAVNNAFQDTLLYILKTFVAPVIGVIIIICLGIFGFKMIPKIIKRRKEKSLIKKYGYERLET